MHNKGLGPAAFVDIRTLNGQNHLKPKDKRLRMPNYSYGGGSSSSNNPAGFAAIAPSAPQEPDVPPMAAQSYTDLSSQVKKAPVISATFDKPRKGFRMPKPKPAVSRNTKRKRVDDIIEPNPLRRPKPFKTGTKRMRENEEEDPNPLVRRPNPKPQGRLNKKPPKTFAPLVQGNTKKTPPPPPGNAGKKMASKKMKSS